MTHAELWQEGKTGFRKEAVDEIVRMVYSPDPLPHSQADCGICRVAVRMKQR